MKPAGAPWHGARVSAVNPAHTSQTCNRCGHVDAKSRRIRDLFTCTRCGHHTHKIALRLVREHGFIAHEESSSRLTGRPRGCAAGPG
ncbi:zinc ribbon domain-containing protein [Streptomyces sp. NPDC056656]|uniref:zinc ribbon domain-containing protein n=1 Tax=Streptomyces sp. NPDC056656 TaxID=3345895 RepID=UPI0036BBE9DB